MKQALSYIKNICLSIVFGKIVFFGFVLAPKVFKVLPREQAALLQNTLFPNYYFLDVMSFSVLFVILWALKRKTFQPDYLTLKRCFLSQILCLIGLGISLYSYYFMLPAMLELYQSHTESNQERFHYFHQISVALSSALLFISAILIFSSSEKK